MTLDRIREYLSYDPETGVFRWIAKPKGRGNSFNVGDVAGHALPDGYRMIRFARNEFRASRLAWFFVHGAMPPPGIYIDHKNRNPGDNRICNLRACTQAQNMLNAIGRRNAVGSRYKGVSWHGKRRKWQARFRGKHIGYFKIEALAAQAYDRAAIAYSPEFALPNFREGES